MAIDKRKFLVYGSASLGTAMLLKACGTNAPTTTAPAPTTTPAAAGGTIKVGILHSIFLLPEDTRFIGR
jgi:urea transport system substrate-binding protein